MGGGWRVAGGGNQPERVSVRFLWVGGGEVRSGK